MLPNDESDIDVNRLPVDYAAFTSKVKFICYLFVKIGDFRVDSLNTP